MPREVTAYLCEHRCGRRACCSRESVERHEATCFMNPARRSCKTCEHEGDDCGERVCLASDAAQNDPLDEFNVSIDDSRSRIAINCREWTPSKWRFPKGVDVPPWEPLPEPEKHEFADF